MVEIIIAGISGISLGVYAGLRYSNYLISKQISKDLKDKNKKVKDTFDKIFGNMNNVSFSKRVNNYVYLSNEDITILFDMRKNIVYLSSGDDFITDSRHLDEASSNKLLNDINKHFYNEINDVLVFGEYILSRNLSSISFEPSSHNDDYDEQNVFDFQEVKFNVDALLDKINSFGISSLTEEEIEFLKNQD